MNHADKVILIANDLFAEASCAWGVYIMDALLPQWHINAVVPSGRSGLGKSGRDFGQADGRPDTERPAALCQHDDHIRSRWDNYAAVIQFTVNAQKKRWPKQ